MAVQFYPLLIEYYNARQNGISDESCRAIERSVFSDVDIRPYYKDLIRYMSKTIDVSNGCWRRLSVLRQRDVVTWDGYKKALSDIDLQPLNSDQDIYDAYAAVPAIPDIKLSKDEDGGKLVFRTTIRDKSVSVYIDSSLNRSSDINNAAAELFSLMAFRNPSMEMMEMVDGVQKRSLEYDQIKEDRKKKKEDGKTSSFGVKSPGGMALSYRNYPHRYTVPINLYNSIYPFNFMSDQEIDDYLMGRLTEALNFLPDHVKEMLLESRLYVFSKNAEDYKKDSPILEYNGIHDRENGKVFVSLSGLLGMTTLRHELGHRYLPDKHGMYGSADVAVEDHFARQLSVGGLHCLDCAIDIYSLKNSYEMQAEAFGLFGYPWSIFNSENSDFLYSDLGELFRKDPVLYLVTSRSIYGSNEDIERRYSWTMFEEARKFVEMVGDGLVIEDADRWQEISIDYSAEEAFSGLVIPKRLAWEDDGTKELYVKLKSIVHDHPNFAPAQVIFSDVVFYKIYHLFKTKCFFRNNPQVRREVVREIEALLSGVRVQGSVAQIQQSALSGLEHYLTLLRGYDYIDCQADFVVREVSPESVIDYDDFAFCLMNIDDGAGYCYDGSEKQHPEFKTIADSLYGVVHWAETYEGYSLLATAAASYFSRCSNVDDSCRQYAVGQLSNVAPQDFIYLKDIRRYLGLVNDLSPEIFRFFEPFVDFLL